MVGPPPRAAPSRVFRNFGADDLDVTEGVGLDAVDEDMMEAEDMQGPHVTARQREIGNWLKETCHMPSSLLAIYYIVSLRTWGAFIVRSHQTTMW